MALGLTNLDIKPVKGNAALLPNQPIIQGCKVVGETLKPGDAVVLAGNMQVTKATTEDLCIGVVVGNPLKTGFKEGEYVSVFPIGSFVYLVAGAADFIVGDNVGVDANGEVVMATSTSLGIAWTEPEEAGDLVIVQIKPEIISASSIGEIQNDIADLENALETKAEKVSIGDGLQLEDKIMYGWTGDIEGYPTLYTLSATPEASGVVVYAFEDGVFEKFVDDATYADDAITITLAGQQYTYDVDTTKDTQGQFLSVISE